jgi:hypothetical protein
VPKLSRTDDRLVLLAKDDTGIIGDEDLRARERNAQYAQIFDAVTQIEPTDGQQTLMDREVDALDVVAEGTSAEGPQRIRE